MALTISDVLSSATTAEWEAKILAWGTALGLNITSWQPGGAGRTIVTMMATALSETDALSAQLAAGGWLDTASAVTPEGGPGWLDLCAQYGYDVTRTPATYGTSTVQLTNTGAAVGPLAAGTYHLRAASGNTYTNSAAITIGAGGTTTIGIVCDQAAAVDIAGSSLTAITAFPGVTVGLMGSGVVSPASAVGSPVESNADLVARCRLKLGTLGAHGAADSYQYFARSSSLAGYPLLSSPITRCAVSADSYSGGVIVLIANSSGAVAVGDVPLMQAYLDGLAVPDGETMTVQSAVNHSIPVVVQVWCPVAYSTQVVTDVQSAVIGYLASLDIGGEATESGTQGVSYNALENYVARTVTYLRTEKTTLDGTSSSVALSYNEVATAASITVTYMGV